MAYLGNNVRPLPVSCTGYESIRVAPLTGTIGAEITGVNLNELSAAQREEIRQAFHQYLVLVIRDQHELTPESHIAFAKLFGELQPISHLPSVPGYPEIQPIHRDADDQRAVTGEVFHNDSTYEATPPRAVAMRAVKLPPFGGDTGFANLYLAYETLSPAMREMLDGLKVVHSAKRLFGTGVDQSRFFMKKMDPTQGDQETVHPLVLTHPETGRKSVFINPAYSIRIAGMTDAESAPILDFLYRHATFLPFTVRVRWLPGTLVLWDNWAAYHSAIGDYQGYERTLHRVTVGGVVPR